MRWVVLLRAVNLGARNKVPMAQLRALVEEEADYGNVRTYIASGNVLLDGPRSKTAVARKLEQVVAQEFGVKTAAILRTPQALADTVEAHPFRSASETHVVFLGAKPKAAAIARLEAAAGGVDHAALVGGEVYLRLPRGVHGSGLSVARIESLLEVPATLRNWRTVTALAQLAAEA